MVLPYINMNPPRMYTCSQSWTLLPPPSPYHPSGSSQCTSPKHPVSCIEPGLAIHFLYDIIHVLMPFSQIIPPFPLPQSPKDCFIYLPWTAAYQAPPSTGFSRQEYWSGVPLPSLEHPSNTKQKGIIPSFEPVLMRWMKLEPIIQSEVSHKEKHQYSILMHIYVI